jgi:glycosyltransferase involved in cell wall biosynthesis
VQQALGPTDVSVAEPRSVARPASRPAGGASRSETAKPDAGGWPQIGSISVVVPMYNEEGNLPELHRRLTGVLTGLSLPYEFVFVDDGSTDATWSIIKELRAGDGRVVALRHRRNFGKARALANGFAVARGDAVITMDGDLQDDPDELPRFIETLNDGFDLVSGWKQRRQDPLGKTAPSRVFNWTVRRASGVQLHDFNCGFKGYRREVTRSIRLYGELHRFTPVLAHAEGFRIAELPVKHHPRTWGKSKYGWSRLVKGFLDLLTVTFLTNYRQRPMHLFGLPGLLSLFIGVVIGLVLTFQRLVLDEAIGTRPLLMLSVLLVVIGAQFFALGLLGEFLAHGSNGGKPEPAGSLRERIGVTDEPLLDAHRA